MSSTVLLAQAVGGVDSDAVLTVLNYGVLGAAVAAFISGRLVSGKEHDSLKEDRDRARTEVSELNELIRDRVIPALTDVARLVEK